MIDGGASGLASRGVIVPKGSSSLPESCLGSAAGLVDRMCIDLLTLAFYSIIYNFYSILILQPNALFSALFSSILYSPIFSSILDSPRFSLFSSILLYSPPFSILLYSPPFSILLYSPLFHCTENRLTTS